MSQEKKAKGVSRRRFLNSSAGLLATSAIGTSLLAACGDSLTATPATASTTSAATGATTNAVSTTAATGATTAAVGATGGTPIKIGVILPFSGVYTQLGNDIVDGMNLYFESIGGVVTGRKIEIIKEDEENDPQAAIRKAKKLLESDRVDLLTGIVSSSVAIALRDVVDSAKQVLVISNAGAKALTGQRFSKYIFRTSFSNGQIVWPLGEWAYKNVGKKAFLTAPDYAAGDEFIESFETTFSKAGGQVIGKVKPPFGKTSDYAPFLTQIQQAKPDFVYAFFSGTEAVNFVKQYEQFGLKKEIPLIGAGFLAEEDTLPAQGQSANGIRSTLHYSAALATPENKKFVEEVQTKYKKAPSTFILQGYDAARFIVEGIKGANGDVSDKAALIKALEGVKFTSPRGPLEIDSATHGLTQNIYLRELVIGSDGKWQNKILATYEKVADINTLLKG